MIYRVDIASVWNIILLCSETGDGHYGNLDCRKADMALAR